MKNLLLILLLNSEDIEQKCENKIPEDEFSCMLNEDNTMKWTRKLDYWQCEVHPTNITCCKQVGNEWMCCDAEVNFGMWTFQGCYESDSINKFNF